jgi:exopolyphosphatase/pppGpp-phosphohydrolase
MQYKRLIDLLKTLQFKEDSHESHPEENVLCHSAQSFIRAKKESCDKELQVASLFHDIGKVIENRGHEKFSVDILQSFGYNNDKVLWLIKNHMRIRFFLNGMLKKKKKLKKLLENKWVSELIHLRRIDGLSRVIGIVPIIDIQEVNHLLGETNEKSQSW